MPTKRPPRTAAIRSWVAVSSVIVFLSVWLAVLTLGKGGLATGNASAPAATPTTTSTTTAADSSSGQSSTSSSSAPSLSTSQS